MHYNIYNKNNSKKKNVKYNRKVKQEIFCKSDFICLFLLMLTLAVCNYKYINNFMLSTIFFKAPYVWDTMTLLNS